MKRPPFEVPIPTHPHEVPLASYDGDWKGDGGADTAAYLQANLYAIVASMRASADVGRPDTVLLTGRVEMFDGLFEGPFAREVAPVLAHCRRAGCPNVTLGVSAGAAGLALVALGAGESMLRTFMAQYDARGAGTVVVVALPSGVGLVCVTPDGEPVMALAPGGSA